MEVIDYRWIGHLVHDYDATCDFLDRDLGLELEWRDEENDISIFRFPSGQLIEVFGPKNRTRDPLYKHFNGPVLGIQVSDIEEAQTELVQSGAEFVTDIHGASDGSVRWAYFWGPDGQFYSLVERSD